jgi:hypothetical protein
MKEYAEDEEAQTIAIFARQRAAGALHVSQGQAADVTEDGSSEGAPEEKRGEATYNSKWKFNKAPQLRRGCLNQRHPWIVWRRYPQEVWLRRHQLSNNKLNSISKGWNLK